MAGTDKADSGGPPLHALDPTARFSDRAADYAASRPGYPAAAIDAVLAGLGDRAALDAADVGAGTGISARLLAERGVRVVAIEPNAAMRDAAEPHPLVRVRDGAAERTGLPDASVGLVLCAQAFHWFRRDEALAEFRRILRPRGRLALVWNYPDTEDPFTAEYYRLVHEASGEHPAVRSRPETDAVVDDPRFIDPASAWFANRQALDEEGLIRRAMSASYLPRAGPGHDRLIEGLRAAHRRFAGFGGSVTLAYRTLVWTAVAEGGR